MSSTTTMTMMMMAVVMVPPRTVSRAVPGSPWMHSSGELALLAHRHEGGREGERRGVPDVGDREARQRRYGGAGQELRGVLRAQGPAGPEGPGALGDGGERETVVGHGHQSRDDDEEDGDREVERGGEAEE